MAALGGHRAQGVTVSRGCSAPGLSWMIWETPRVSPGWTSPERSQVGPTGVTSLRGLAFAGITEKPFPAAL